MSVTFPSGVVPVTNATLTAVKGGGTSENYRDDDSGEATLWTGEVDVWLGEELLTEQGRLLDQTSRAYLAVPQGFGITVNRGYKLQVTHNAVSEWRTVDDIHEYDLAGLNRFYFVNV